ncbi:hypothetical protein Chor_004424 [Crotalus horridus]
MGNSLVEEGGEETEESSEADGEDEMDSSQEDPEKTLDEQKHQELCGKVRDVLTSFKNQQLETLLEEGFLIPTADTLQILNIHPQGCVLKACLENKLTTAFQIRL